jgi:hypothetical protein
MVALRERSAWGSLIADRVAFVRTVAADTAAEPDRRREYLGAAIGRR